MSYITDSYALSGETLVKQFKKRNMEAFIAQPKRKPKKKSFPWFQMALLSPGVVQNLWKKPVYVKPSVREIMNLLTEKKAKTPEESRALYGQIVCADYFLTSSNAFTKDGILVNIDGASNRVACIAHGPAHVIFLISMDKLCANVDEAIDRIHTHACPSQMHFV